jgi:hypothetical protein
MAYSPIEESYMNGFVSSQFATPEPEPVLLAQNKNISYPNEQFTETDGGAMIGYRLNMPKGLNTPENIKKVGDEILPAGGAMLKGAGQASVGMYGDIEGLGRMVLNYMGVDVNKETKLPTTEDVKTFLDKYIPVDEKYSTFEKAGELASPAGAYGLGKSAIKAIKSTKGLPVGNSIKMMDGTEITLSKAPKIESKAFKNWFGASKATDDTGTPIVVYHARRNDFESFDPDRAEGKSKGTGTFFSSSPDVAATYNTSSEHNIVPAYLSLKNPVIVDGGGANWNKIAGDAKVYLPGIKQSAKEDELLLSELTGSKPDLNATRTLKEQDSSVKDVFKGNLSVFNETATTDDIARWARSQGYDGVIFKNVVDHGPAGRFSTDKAFEPSNIYVAFKPTQIKSVMNKGTFDPDDWRMLHGGAAVTGGAGASQQEESK